MNTSSYLKRKPHARGTSIEWRSLRDKKLEQLRAELIAQRKRRSLLDWLWKDILSGKRWSA